LETYPTQANNSTTRYLECRGVSRKRVIETAKAQVSTMDLAERLCPGGLRKAGKELVGLCPLHDDTRKPNFYVNPEKDTWFCFVCLVGGDVIELARFAWGYDKSEVAMAAADLLHEFGYETPGRPERWFKKQERQHPIREAIKDAKFRRVQRRLYRWLYAPIIAGFEDEVEREEEARIGWDECEMLARLIISGTSMEGSHHEG
jgi:DNA primase